jgi:hypothetical protein
MAPGKFPLMRAVRLADWRLAESGAWRFARGVSIVLSIGFASSVVYLAIAGKGAQVAGVLARAAILNAWITGLVLGGWNATDRASADEADGILGLARCHGLPIDSLPVARALAGWWRLSLLVLLGTLPVAAASIASAPTLSLVAWRLASLAPLALFSCGVGLVGGALASACGVWTPRHGKSLLAAIVVLPWALDGVLLVGHAHVGSLPGILGFLATLTATMGAG